MEADSEQQTEPSSSPREGCDLKETAAKVISEDKKCQGENRPGWVDGWGEGVILTQLGGGDPGADLGEGVFPLPGNQSLPVSWDQGHNVVTNSSKTTGPTFYLEFSER